MPGCPGWQFRDCRFLIFKHFCPVRLLLQRSGLFLRGCPRRQFRTYILLFVTPDARYRFCCDHQVFLRGCQPPLSLRGSQSKPWQSPPSQLPPSLRASAHTGVAIRSSRAAEASAPTYTKSTPEGAFLFWSRALRVDMHFLFAEIVVATSVCTGGRNCPPDSSSAMGSTPSLLRKEQDHLSVVLFFWSRVRESNPPSRLGKPLYYRYTNPALSALYQTTL